MVIKRQLYFPTPVQLNDPYDCRISIREALRQAIEGAERRGKCTFRQTVEHLQKIDNIYEKMEADIGSVGVLSFSKCPTNVVMWTHYADNHRGFCAGFQLSEKFTTHHNDEQIFGICDVQYSGENPFVEFFEEIAIAEDPPSWEEFWQSLLSMGMVAKAVAWRYEEEVRVLRKGGGPVSFEPLELAEIVFGMNMPASDRATLRHVLASGEWSHVKFREIVRSKGFAVDIANA